MRITWIGNHEEGVKAFCQTAQSNGIDAFITLDDSSFSKRSAGSRAYLEICEAYGIPYYPVDTIKGERAYEIIRGENPELLVVLGWSEILPERLLDIPSIGTVGTHAALLPHNRGSAPINWALIHGETETGNTMMWLDKEVDAGAIIDQIAFQITPFDTCKTLYDKVAETNAVMLARLLKSLQCGQKPLFPLANETDEPILPRRRPKDGIINWNQSARELYDFVRALTRPYPGAFTFLNGKKYLIWEAAVLPMTTQECPGTILGTGYGFAKGSTGLLVATAHAILYVTELEEEGGCCYQNQALYAAQFKGVFTDE